MLSAEQQARVEALNGALLGCDSATEALARWCGVAPGEIVARMTQSLDQEADAAVRDLLRVAPGQAVFHRHVELAVGGQVLSEADNWYVPDRLTADMNRRLRETQTPFGPIVRSLGFRRRTLDAAILGEGDPSHIIRHRALLVLEDGTPISLVAEAYKRALLATPRA